LLVFEFSLIIHLFDGLSRHQKIPDRGFFDDRVFCVLYFPQGFTNPYFFLPTFRRETTHIFEYFFGVLVF
jgi:hypothetical protein